MLNINMELSMERTDQELEDEWRTINWKEVGRYVDRMQGKIFHVTKNREFKKLKNLQTLARIMKVAKLVSSRFPIFLSMTSNRKELVTVMVQQARATYRESGTRGS